MNLKTFLCLSIFLATGCGQPPVEIPSTQPQETETEQVTSVGSVESEGSVGSSYCTEQKEAIDTFLAQPNPSEYIVASDPNENLMLWKELFMRNNDLTEDYFNSHIRIIDAENSSGSIQYVYILDTFFVSEYNAIPPEMDLDEIRELTSLNYYTFNTNFYITPIRAQGTLIAPTITCDEAVEIAKSIDSSLEPTTSLFRNEEWFRNPSNNRAIKYTEEENEIVINFSNKATTCSNNSESATFDNIYISILSGKIVRQEEEECGPIYY